jgi:hypothetical protein
MHFVTDGYKGLQFLVRLNWDRLLWPVAIVAALCFGATLPGL